MCKAMVTGLWWPASPEEEQWPYLNKYIQRVSVAALSDMALLLSPRWERDTHVVG